MNYAITYVYINLLLLNYKFKHKIIGFFVQQIILLGFFFGIHKLPVVEDNTLLLALCSWGFLYLVLTCFYKEPLKRRILFSLIEICLTVLAKIFAAMLALATSSFHESAYSSVEYNALGNVYSSLILFIIAMLFVVCWKVFIEHIWIKEYVLYIMIPVYQAFILYFYYKSCSRLESRELVTGYILVFFSVLIDIGLNYLINGMMQKLEVERELETLYIQRETEKQYYEMTNQNLEEMKQIKNHILEQLQDAHELIFQEEQKRVRELLDGSYEELRKKGARQYCQNSIVNAIFTIKFADMEEKGIRTEYQCNIPEELNMEMIDVCSLFTNLLDNAIEACGKIINQDSWIKVHVGTRGGYLTVKVENAYSGEVYCQNGYLITNKNDKLNHGFGLKLVGQIVEKYEGAMQVSTQKNVFSVIASAKL